MAEAKSPSCAATCQARNSHVGLHPGLISNSHYLSVFTHLFDRPTIIRDHQSVEDGSAAQVFAFRCRDHTKLLLAAVQRLAI
ncbi:hypothetical protein BVG79_p1000068 (plasmid) [Ketogulonicigenium robustum]|uniref:Uncharacterized protein n=1 Tax=Ketogulonicigenium robustum TaxID=92947 RepID=A0A1W6P3E1_9RHOB|nr:hypothetical protein BVG79_p1000068 [Ketogulonicigenium robustum]